MSKLLLTAALALAAVAPTYAQAQDNWYGVVAFENPTSVTINYSFRWGNGEWQEFTVLPGETVWHAWSYSYANENASPVPEISFDADLSYANYQQAYTVEAYRSPSTGTSHAKLYRFETVNYGAWLDLNDAS